MKKNQLRNIIKEEIQKVMEGDIGEDVNSFAKDLEQKGIAQYAQRTTAGFGRPLGKFMVRLVTDGKSYNELKTEIEKHYKNTGLSTNFSSDYYYSPQHKLYFYFYSADRINKSYKPDIDKMVVWDYNILTKRRLPKK